MLPGGELAAGTFCHLAVVACNQPLVIGLVLFLHCSAGWSHFSSTPLTAVDGRMLCLAGGHFIAACSFAVATRLLTCALLMHGDLGLRLWHLGDLITFVYPRNGTSMGTSTLVLVHLVMKCILQVITRLQCVYSMSELHV